MSNEGVIATDRPAAAEFNGMACTVLRAVTEADGPAFNDKTPQIICLVDGREVYFYDHEVRPADQPVPDATPEEPAPEEPAPEQPPQEPPPEDTKA